MNERNNDRGGKKKKSTYKLKRSFTRNKKIRSDSPDKARRTFKKEGDEDRATRRPKGFDKEKREVNRDKRSERKERYSSQRSDDRPKSFSKDKGEGYSREKRNDRGGDDFKRKPFSKEKGEGFGRDKRNQRGGDDFKRKSFSKDRNEGFDRDKRSERGGDDFKRKSFSKDRSEGYDREKRNERGGGYERKEKSFSKQGDRGHARPYEKKEKPYRRDDSYRDKNRDSKPGKKTYAQEGLIRLNRYISNAGICSRREADDLIETGCVSVNGKIVTEMGYKVKPTDVVTYGGERLKTEKHVYLLLNKPKDYITTSEDERGRRTVMELIEGAVKERVYPVGRLDRNTTGLLLFTNDGELAKKLTHPQHRVQKLYHVELDKNLKHDDLLAIQNGLELEDGFIKPDEVAYAGESKREVGIMIHSGRNRIVRRIFESLGYEVLRLDRTIFAGLTKKDLPRGRWRMLTPKEVSFLKMM